MIEKVIYSYLSGALPVPVYMEVPETPPISFVVLEKTGSSARNWLGSATFAVQSYAVTLLGAAELNELVKTAMLTAITLDEIASVDLNSDYNYTDTSTKKYRYQAVFDVYHY